MTTMSTTTTMVSDFPSNRVRIESKRCADCGRKHNRVGLCCETCSVKRKTVAAYQRRYREQNKETVAAYQRRSRTAGHIIEYQGRGRPPLLCAACRAAS